MEHLKKRIADYEGNQLAEKAFNDHLDDIYVTVIGRVKELLKPDFSGVPHQRFIIELPNINITLLVSYNIDAKAPIRLNTNDVVKVRGVYKWNRYGGIIHLAHEDPTGEHEDGVVKILKKAKPRLQLAAVP